MRRHVWQLGLCGAALGLLLGACGDSPPSTTDSRPLVVATTTIWADIARSVVCDGSVRVESLIPTGVDSHAFEASLQDRALLAESALVIANGLVLEASLAPTLESYVDDGGELLSVGSTLDPSELITGALGADPHIWLDPLLVADVLAQMADAITTSTGLASGSLDVCVGDYANELRDTHSAAASTLDVIPTGMRRLVTNHDALGYFARRFDFEIVGVVVGSTSSLAQPSQLSMEVLLESMENAGATVIFVERGLSHVDADALADRIPGAEVVELEVEALGAPGSGAETYLGLITTNARRIADALEN